MSERDDEELSRLVAELVTALRDLEAELDPPRGPRPPTPRELRRFTSEVAIPGAILVLETNVRALRLLQRALELSERADRTREDARLGDRARTMSDTTLDKLDDALADLESAVRGRPDNEEAARILDDARQLREEVRTRLAEYGDEADDPADGASASHDDRTADDETGSGEERADGETGPQVDVDAELESIKADLSEQADDTPGDGADTPENGADTPDDDDVEDRTG